MINRDFFLFIQEFLLKIWEVMSNVLIIDGNSLGLAENVYMTDALLSSSVIIVICLFIWRLRGGKYPSEGDYDEAYSHLERDYYYDDDFDDCDDF